MVHRSGDYATRKLCVYEKQILIGTNNMQVFVPKAEAGKEIHL